MNDLYIDEVFFKVYDPWSEKFQSVSPADSKIFRDFWYLIEEDRAFTRSQANLLLKLLQKYKTSFAAQGIEVDILIKNYQWKKPFREIDLTKRVYIETDQDGVIWVCLKFPYALKSKFEDAFVDVNERNFSFWDDEQKVRKINLYKINFLQMLEFAKEHQLELDKTVLDVADEIDEIWQNREQLEKRFSVSDQEITLINASESAKEYFDGHRTGIFDDNVLLARELGHVCESKLELDLLNKICSTDNNLFWANDLNKFLTLYQKTSSKTCVILDRTCDYKKWIENFISRCDQRNIARSDIKICFRESGKESSFNLWVKESGFGGSVDFGRIYIFLAAPAKWLYKDLESFKIILVNSLFPYTNKNTQNLINHHPLVIYAGDAKPSVSKGFKIEEL